MNTPQLPAELWDWRPAPAPLDAQAEIVRLRAAGYGLTTIARSLNRRGIPTPSGRGRWHAETIKRRTDDHARERYNAYMRQYRRR